MAAGPIIKTQEELARQLWAVGDIVRLQVLDLLPIGADCKHGNNVSQLADKLNLSQPTVSHHLRVLRQAGIVEYRKMCRDVYYWKNADEAHALVESLRRVLIEDGEQVAPARHDSTGQ
ncbi:helix-turn-helix transcriptional regulator [Ruficoccus amylovorans]|uniref:Helix-turn-helix transcriptional regulator n=1 Tax=Ruficoccus amylovorans TaxID=1804625 RepID=A0A842HGN5_9BACT|nr:helix-turn-helix transcriptional regulator [Ruficoccus amylovorans]MBC2595340.1 helix-turn-helix transcriptional regulator [Ruficoccus amylovorans]